MLQLDPFWIFFFWFGLLFPALIFSKKKNGINKLSFLLFNFAINLILQCDFEYLNYQNNGHKSSSHQIIKSNNTRKFKETKKKKQISWEIFFIFFVCFNHLQLLLLSSTSQLTIVGFYLFLLFICLRLLLFKILDYCRCHII